LERIFADIDYAILRVEKTSSNAYSGMNRIDETGIHSDLTRCDYVILPSAQLLELQPRRDTPANMAPSMLVS
jgi:hypothetical protein